MEQRESLPADAEPPQAAAGRAARAVLSGDVDRTGRRWLGVLSLVLFAAFCVNTYLVETWPLLPFDVPVALIVQSTNWGPLVPVMELTNYLGGARQVALGAAAVLLLTLLDRRAGWLMALGALASLLDNALKVSFARERPTADLVQILTPAGGYSYPSGHAVFFTWLSFMLAFSAAPRVLPRLRPVVWLLAGGLALTACLGRVWAGDHWPSDVLGGLLLGLGWSAFVLWLPERWLPQPSLRWLRGRRAG